MQLASINGEFVWPYLSIHSSSIGEAAKDEEKFCLAEAPSGQPWCSRCRIEFCAEKRHNFNHIFQQCTPSSILSLAMQNIRYSLAVTRHRPKHYFIEPKGVICRGRFLSPLMSVHPAVGQQRMFQKIFFVKDSGTVECPRDSIHRCIPMYLFISIAQDLCSRHAFWQCDTAIWNACVPKIVTTSLRNQHQILQRSWPGSSLRNFVMK
ncbi:hypothetical protein F5879DRAFT_222709 [Lentinula edodes]|nr:hypothetical protein F5879DRAFT_222709 [Lentinula edodes]